MNRLTEGFFGALLGYLGAWAVRLLTLNRCKPDPESWSMIMLGFTVLVAFLIFAAKGGVR